LRYVANDFSSLFSKINTHRRIIFIAGYPKSGTTWVENFIGMLPGYNPRRLLGNEELLRMHLLDDTSFECCPKKGYSALKTHIYADKKNISILKRDGITKIVVMYRDLRDIIVSHYYHILKENPWRPEEESYLNYLEVSKETGMRHCLEHTTEDYIIWIEGWYQIRDNGPLEILFLKYEDLIENPTRFFTRLCNFYSIDLDEKKLKSIIERSNHKKQKLFGPPGTRSTIRRGGSGNWVTELTDENLSYIYKRAGNLLTKMGYLN
jgi:hypothetical protein